MSIELNNQNNEFSTREEIKSSNSQRFSEEKFQFSCKGHLLAVEQGIYKQLFEGRSFFLKDVTKMDKKSRIIYDGDLATDYIAFVQSAGRLEGIERHLIQERVLRPTPKNCPECVTISVKHKDGRECEWFKLHALSYFVWLFYDEAKNELTNWIIVKEPYKIKELFEQNKIEGNERTNSESGQLFLSFSVKELERHNLIFLRKQFLH
ncbi:hypothetical protein H839_08239 [Parageobacillus genomosp. 1]|uniref:Uncharacterized protein n=1 Tax=Parageobacillus genomosp. 1 TaxID=1295642 RepID=A0ABC9VGH2_9BACL|nr:hypothetical protein [Parageobacillus genomosp. 1]EZP77607.1 hypothetical protein H839_08239 [Parageobacillus genomosp. 1]